MIRKIITLVYLTTCFFSAQSQIIYSVNPIAFSPVSLNSATIVNGLQDDSYSSVIPIGFNFTFFGFDYNSLVVSSNGLVSFDLNKANNASPWATSGDTLPSNKPQYNNSIMGVYHDMDASFLNTNSNIFVQLIGSAPNRQFVISYEALPMFSCNSNRASSQIILFEGTNNIEVHVEKKELCTTWNDGHAILGIQNIIGNEAHYPLNKNGNSQWTSFQEAWRFNFLGFYLNNPEILSRNKKIEIYPSPATNYIYTKSNKIDLNQSEILNIHGQKINITSYKDKIDVRHLPSGFYWLRIGNDYNKFFKQ